ncbi:MAG: hypothetical protein QNL91_04605 [Candidatus Krumholzibacteria bacterium]|nr:hypothetical protein [Candidatus Krumholzibacteria bacterium]
MFTKRTLLIPCLMCLMAISLTAGSAQAQTEMAVSYTWTAPTTGTAVDHYVVQHSVDGGTWSQVSTVSTNNYTLTATIGNSHQIRVAGVDASDRQGPYSVASDPYSPDPGSPSQPGKPIVF